MCRIFWGEMFCGFCFCLCLPLCLSLSHVPSITQSVYVTNSHTSLLTLAMAQEHGSGGAIAGKPRMEISQPITFSHSRSTAFTARTSNLSSLTSNPLARTPQQHPSARPDTLSAQAQAHPIPAPKARPTCLHTRVCVALIASAFLPSLEKEEMVGWGEEV